MDGLVHHSLPLAGPGPDQHPLQGGRGCGRPPSPRTSCSRTAWPQSWAWTMPRYPRALRRRVHLARPPGSRRCMSRLTVRSSTVRSSTVRSSTVRSRLHTPVCDLLGIRIPIVQTGMGWVLLATPGRCWIGGRICSLPREGKAEATPEAPPPPAWCLLWSTRWETPFPSLQPAASPTAEGLVAALSYGAYEAVGRRSCVW